MRILRVAQKVYPDVKGGGPYHVHAMSRDQAEMGHDVTVLTIRQNPSLPQVEERDGYTVVRFDAEIAPLGNDISSGVVQYLAQAEDFDVIHAHSHLYFSTNVAALKRALGDVPLAITNHGLYSQTAPEWVFDLYLRTVGEWTFNQADVVFCYTETDKERVRELGVSSPIKVIPNGIDTKRFTPDGSKSDLIDHDGPVVLFVGRLVEGKRPEIAIKTLAAVREQYPNAQLFLCGEGPLQNVLSEQVRECGLRDAVTFLGQVPYEEMPGVYRCADALVLPSRSEGVPRTVLEALASNVPVVTSDLPQVRSIVDGGGITVETGNVTGFAAGLVTVFEAEYEPRSRVVDSFDWTATVNQTTSLLDGL